MRHAHGTHLPRPTPASGTRGTAAICGFAILSLVTVLGVSIACDAADGQKDEAPVHLLIRPVAAGTEATAIATADPFGAPSCVAMAASRTAEAR